MTSLLRKLIEHAEDFSEPTVTTSTFDELDWLPSDYTDIFRYASQAPDGPPVLP